MNEKENLKELRRGESFFFPSEVVSRTSHDLELEEQIYEELKRRRDDVPDEE